MKKFFIVLLLFLSMFSFANAANYNYYSNFYILDNDGSNVIGVTFNQDNTLNIYKLEIGVGCGLNKNKSAFIGYDTFIDGVGNSIFIPTGSKYGKKVDECYIFNTKLLLANISLPN